MSRYGRRQEVLFDLFLGYDMGSGERVPGVLEDLPLDRVSKLIDQILDVLEGVGEAEKTPKPPEGL